MVLVSRGEETLAATAREIAQETGRRVIAIPADTGNDESVRGMVAKAAQDLGRIDILVNGAAKVGGGPAPKLAGITEDLFWDDMNTKVMGYIRCAKEVAPYMTKQGWGRIINISGMAARSSGSAIGSMRNVAVSAMTKNLADELGPSGINVTVVHPGMTVTERTAEMVTDLAGQQGISEEEAEQRMAQNTSVGRLIDAVEIAYVVAFLASPKSVAINGDAIAAGGGVGRAIHY